MLPLQLLAYDIARARGLNVDQPRNLAKTVDRSSDHPGCALPEGPRPRPPRGRRLAAAIVVAGCGGGSSSGGGGEPASLAPKGPGLPRSRPGAEGKSSEEFNELAQNVLGIEDVGEYVAEQLEEAALGEGEKFNFEEEVEPWLGEKAGMYLDGYDGNDFHGYGVTIETTNAGEAEEFIEKRVEEDQEEPEEGEFEGDKYYVEPDGETVLGVIGDYVVFGETKADFEEMVEDLRRRRRPERIGDLQAGDRSGDERRARQRLRRHRRPDHRSEGPDRRRNRSGLRAAGDRTAQRDRGRHRGPALRTGRARPHHRRDQGAAPGGDASKLLESLPATAVLGFASPEFGKTFGEGIHEFSEQGVPGQLEPGELEAALESLGINLEQLSASIGDVARLRRRLEHRQASAARS